MKLDIFAEMQQPKAIWDGEDHEQRLVQETQAQARLADTSGYGCLWLVEHHGAVLGLHKINHPSA